MKRRKAQQQESYSMRSSLQIVPSLLQTRDGDLVTPSAIFFLLSSATEYQVSLLLLSIPPPPREQINENQTKLPGLGGCSNSGSTY